MKVDLSVPQPNMQKACTKSLREVGFSKARVAEREGFEPPMGLHPCRISSAVHSTTLPPLRGHGPPLPARRTR
ncbi:hypothetical protein MESS4_260005 [Mesorhizobium sp. STM 4661]|nr:hypothetical protein MESS4_260005 [Mesorhizobium sp. STM 4661]